MNSPSSIMLPSFDELKQLAKDDPDAFNALKKQLCQQAIMNSSKAMQPRLMAQQSRLDKVIAKCNNPNHVNVILNKELHEQLSKFQQALQKHSPDDTTITATILPFKPTKNDQ